ncbi:ferrochelatase [Propionibacterium cyclohexanicum]|uniref:Coproporphyrin III ferrochelatase n=1 Tax=Propionibacterium cyclohexanicum TaxID=64702 RepID=A0A1H9SUU8_9ACTN|nr:ferrochelatase [Propionibacterium cyclohexanicum]SER88772.1 ferrochelatase [Propionibacterium cyclohexanicum]
MSPAFDAVVVLGFGGPESMDEVPDFLRRVSGGHIPQERLDEVAGHYAHFGGVSPVNAQHRALARALEQRLGARGLALPVVTANRHSAPLMAPVLAQLAEQGARRVLALAAAPFSSYSGCRAYREELFTALPRGRTLGVVKIGCYPQLGALASCQVELLEQAFREAPDAHLVFTTHSIPTAMAASSGPHGGAYVAQHRRLIDTVMAALADRGLAPSWELAYQSRSGSPRTPWLEPDINDVLHRLARQGVRHVVCSPIGFLTDHMEVVWDLDTEASATAGNLGLGFTRVATVGAQPAFLDELARLVAGFLTGEARTCSGGWCGAGCCPNPRGSRPAVEGVTP